VGVLFLRVEEVVERVSLGGGTSVGAGAIDVMLRGNYRLVAEYLHQCVDADIGVGEFGGVDMPQPMYQCAGRSFAVHASFLEHA
jgi:hypothetical protein